MSPQVHAHQAGRAAYRRDRVASSVDEDLDEALPGSARLRASAPARSLRAAALLALALAAAGLATLPARAQAGSSACGELAAAQGPYDYRKETHWVPFIERHHFRPEIEALIRGASPSLGGDIDYVLRYIPNHHRALVAMTRLSERYRWQRPPGATYEIGCYYDRAVRFRPDDVIVRMLYATYLGKRARRDEALAQLAVASESAGENGFTHYNLGLQYYELGNYEKASEHATRALGLGFTRPELVDRLRSKGSWRDLPAASSAPGASTPSPSPRP